VVLYWPLRGDSSSSSIHHNSVEVKRQPVNFGGFQALA